ncbi:MAG: hypothetical protein QNJ94_06865 [Alphaproteobacteria bacterium]|nr:hypothetical protein [Alphaproteobacteria bacterium]
MTESKPTPTMKWLAGAAAAIWLVAIGWQQASDLRVPLILQSHYIDRQMERCTGNVALRYECRSAVRIYTQRHAFGHWVGKLSLVFLPPLAIAFVYRRVARRIWDRAEAARKMGYAQRKQAQRLAQAVAG